MGSLKVSSITLVAALTPLLALAPESERASSLSPQVQEVVCTDKEASKKVTVPEPNSKAEEASKTVTVSVPNSTVKFVCPPDYTFAPPVTNGAGTQNVYSDTSCTTTELLTKYCPTATLKKAVETPKQEVTGQAAKLEAVKTAEQEANQPAATLEVRELPADKTAVFYVQCKPPGANKTAKGQDTEAQAACVVEVTVNQAANTGQAGGVHICRQGSITVNVPDKNSSVQFSCDKSFTLYPTDPAKVFKDDCKTLEPLKDMTRTAAAAVPAPTPVGRTPPANGVVPPIYTLKAVKKPPKRKLCYLCATQEPTDKTAEPPESYCAIYVESSARAPFGLRFTPLALILSSVLAVLRLT